MQWFPDNRSVLLVGRDASRTERLYRQSIEGGLPEPVLPAGIVGALSPQGDRVLAMDSAGSWKLYPLDGSPPRAVQGLEVLDGVVGWSRAGDAVYARRGRSLPLRLQRIDLATGARTESDDIGPRQQAGLLWVSPGFQVFDPDRALAYGYRRELSRLFVVQ